MQFRRFLAQLESHQVIPATERSLYEKSTSTVKDPAKRRELKIQQYRKEKELRTRIEVGTYTMSNDPHDFHTLQTDYKKTS